MPQSADLTLVHLSDVHFRRGIVGTKHDPDRELREALLGDLRTLVPRFGPISGIIITGDIAFSGHPSEYVFARSWITTIAEHLQCDLLNVMVIPGNHDVNRSALQADDKRVANIQRNIRRGANAAKTVARLATVLTSNDGKLLMRPLKAYNAFAKEFKCGITTMNPYWERTFPLGDGSKVIVRGATSTWLSGSGDSERIAKLLYGSAQYDFAIADNAYRVVAVHHPPQNVIDQADAEKAFDFHCHLQLFGHKHDHWISESKTCARIAAGAIQPDRREQPWTPRYNIIQLTGEILEKARRVQIQIFPRRWNDEFRQFMADYTPDAAERRSFVFFGKSH